MVVDRYLGRLELVMGSDVGYGLLKPALAVEIGYMLGVCLQTHTSSLYYLTN